MKFLRPREARSNRPLLRKDIKMQDHDVPNSTRHGARQRAAPVGCRDIAEYPHCHTIALNQSTSSAEVHCDSSMKICVRRGKIDDDRQSSGIKAVTLRPRYQSYAYVLEVVGPSRLRTVDDPG